jgi:hypothetical protein
MTALSKTLFVVLLSSGFAGSAIAATDATPAASTNSQNSGPTTQVPAHIAQKLNTDLGKAGFTDIKIMPSSFLVRAKDSQGHAVMMVINPDSLTEVTEVSAPGSAANKSDGTNSASAGAMKSNSQPANSASKGAMKSDSQPAKQ